MDPSTALSLAALVVSVGSLGVAVWANRISKKALAHSMRAQEEGDQREFDRIRAELLNQISDSRAVLERTRLEIGTLQANFRAEPPAVQSLMANYTGLFSEYLPSVERAITRCDQLWREVSEWGRSKSHTELMEARAVLYRSLQDDRSAQESGTYLVNEFTTKLELARRRHAATNAGTP